MKNKKVYNFQICFDESTGDVEYIDVELGTTDEQKKGDGFFEPVPSLSQFDPEIEKLLQLFPFLAVA